MPTSKRANRRAGARRSHSLGHQLAALQRNLKQAIKANRHQQQLRRSRQQRQKRLLNNPEAERQLQALRRALEFRWLRRRLHRRPSEQQTRWNLAAWFWPRTAETLSTREASALLMRRGAATLLILILISLPLNALPLRLSNPSWYMEVLAYIAENVPVVIIASVLALLSLVLSANGETTTAYRSRLLRLSRLGYILALLLLPLQLGFTSWLYGQAFSINRTQLTAIRANADALISGALQTSTTEQFIAYLRSRNLTGNLESIAAAPLAQVRTEFIRSVKTQQQQQEQNLGQATRTTLLRYTINTIKLFLTLVVLAIFLRGFQALVRRCSPKGAGRPIVSPQSTTPAATAPAELTESP